MRTEHLLMTILRMMDPSAKGRPSEQKDRAADLFWGNGRMLSERLLGVLLPSEDPNWGERWPGGVLNLGCGEHSLRMRRFLQDRLLLGFSYLGGSQQPPMSTDHPDPNRASEQDKSARVCREVTEDIGEALTGEKVLFPSQVAAVLREAAQDLRSRTNMMSMRGALAAESEADTLEHMGKVLVEAGVEGLKNLLLETEEEE